ncbi:MAG: Phosphoglucomutase [Candidatus Anoxychlamydiales bacterium]|nr:Phosphoglucomutase [Candidatus Anoxychlamydiales bacterium]
MDENISAKKRITEWLDGPYDQDTKDEIKKLLKENPSELFSSFSKTLTFGTGGIREKMGIGSNRLNKYTIAKATQALCNYIKSQNIKTPSILIGFDSRKNSKLFAEESAKVIAANGIQAFLFKELRPTPLVSFGCRYKSCISAIMITASHNPKEYNGYKVYWKDGGQVVPPHDVAIIDDYSKIKSIEDVKVLDSLESPLIKMIQDELDDAYIKTLFSMDLFKNEVKNANLKIIYSNLHGTGITLMPKCLDKLGFRDVHIVKEQEEADPNFTNAPKPNPEEKQALEIGIGYLKEKKADIFIASDPDADRMGLVINHRGEEIILTGNQIACIMLEFLCKSKSLFSKTAAVKSIVTTSLFQRICEHYDIHCIDVLTGFKYIASKMNEWEIDNSFEFIFGAEESLGFLIETFVRDKDAISASLLIAKIAQELKNENKTLLDLLYDLYKTHGIYREKQASLTFETKDGMDKMKEIMDKLRLSPPKTIGNLTIGFIDDYLKSTTLDIANNTKTQIALPSSNVLRFWLNDNSQIVIRPSGTEPKIKIYVAVQELNIKDLKKDIDECDMRLNALIETMRLQIKS